VSAKKVFLNKIYLHALYALIFVLLVIIPINALLVPFQITEFNLPIANVKKVISIQKHLVVKNVIINVKLATKKNYALHATLTHSEQTLLNVTVFLAIMKI
jgi:hypothetical protein